MTFVVGEEARRRRGWVGCSRGLSQGEVVDDRAGEVAGREQAKVSTRVVYRSFTDRLTLCHCVMIRRTKLTLPRLGRPRPSGGPGPISLPRAYPTLPPRPLSPSRQPAGPCCPAQITRTGAAGKLRGSSRARSSRHNASQPGTATSPGEGAVRRSVAAPPAPSPPLPPALTSMRPQPRARGLPDGIRARRIPLVGPQRLVEGCANML